MDAAKGPDDPVVPKYVFFKPNPSLPFYSMPPGQLGGSPSDGCVYDRVFLHATDESALSNGVTLETLQKYAAGQEVPGGGGSLEKAVPLQPKQKGGIVRETH